MGDGSRSINGKRKRSHAKEPDSEQVEKAPRLSAAQVRKMQAAERKRRQRAPPAPATVKKKSRKGGGQKPQRSGLRSQSAQSAAPAAATQLKRKSPGSTKGDPARERARRRGAAINRRVAARLGGATAYAESLTQAAKTSTVVRGALSKLQQMDPVRAVGAAAVAAMKETHAAKRQRRGGDKDLSAANAQDANSTLLAAVSNAKGLSRSQLLKTIGRRNDGRGYRDLQRAQARREAGDAWAGKRKRRNDNFMSDNRVRAVIRGLWDKLSVDSPMAKHAARLPKDTRSSRAAALTDSRQQREASDRPSKKRRKVSKDDDPRRKDIRFTPFGAEYVWEELQKSESLMAELRCYGVSPRSKQQIANKTLLSPRAVNAMKPWYVQPLNPCEMNLCVDPYDTEIKYLFLGINSYRRSKHGPGSGCDCTCAVCRPGGATECQCCLLEGDTVFGWLKNCFLCPRKPRTMAVLPGGDKVQANFSDYACYARQCSKCGKEPPMCVREKRAMSTVVPVMAYEEIDGTWSLDHRKWPIRKLWNRFLACLRGAAVGVDGSIDSAVAVRTARQPYQRANGYAYHLFEGKWVDVLRPVLPHLISVPRSKFTSLIEADYMLAQELMPASKEQSQSEFRRPLTVKGCTGNLCYRGPDGTLVWEECTTLCSDKDVKQTASLTEASRRKVEGDASARGIDLGDGCVFLSDNKDSEFKDSESLFDLEMRGEGQSAKFPAIEWGLPDPVSESDSDSDVPSLCLPCAPPARPNCMLLLGCPCKGKCRCDASGGRIKVETNTIRQSQALQATDPIVNANTMARALNTKLRERDGKMDFYARSRVTEVTREDVDVVVQARNTMLGDSTLSGRYKGTKMARCIVYDANKGIGLRPLWCLCAPCLRHDFAACELFEFTGGEATWQKRSAAIAARPAGARQARRSASTSTNSANNATASATDATDDANAPDEFLQSTTGLAALAEGDIVVVHAAVGSDPNFPYFLLYVTSSVAASDGSADGYNSTIERGLSVVTGHLLCPINREDMGADMLAMDSRVAAITVDRVALDRFNKQPLVVRLKVDSTDTCFELDTHTHTDIVSHIVTFEFV
jgi:hypothetical protein